jgi:hypothetical protein
VDVQDRGAGIAGGDGLGDDLVGLLWEVRVVALVVTGAMAGVSACGAR